MDGEITYGHRGDGRRRAREMTALRRWSRITTTVFLAVYVLLLCRNFMMTTTLRVAWPEDLTAALRSVAIVTAFARLMLGERPGRVKALYAVALLAVFITAWFNNRYEDLLDLAVLMAGMLDVPARKIVKVYFATVSTLLFATVAMSLTGVIVNLVYTQDDVTRYSLGICYPTDFAANFFYLGLAWIFLREDRITYPELLLIGATGVGVMLLAHARLTTVCQLMAMVVFMADKFCRDHERVKGVALLRRAAAWLCVLAMPLCAGLFLLASARYHDGGFMAVVNGILSNRLQQSSVGISQYGFSAWGQPIQMVGNGGSSLTFLWYQDYFFLDSSFVSVALRYGTMVLLIVLAGYTALAAQAARARRYCAAYIVALLAVNGMIEHHMMEINYSPFIMLLASRLFETPEEKEDAPIFARWRELWRAKKPGGRRLAAGIFLGVYAVASLLLLGVDLNSASWSVYDMQVLSDEGMTQNLTADYVYKEYFFTPLRVDGLQICPHISNLKPIADLKVMIADASTDEVLGVETVPYEKIASNKFVDVPFSGYHLEEGKRYYFTVARADRQKGSLGEYQLRTGVSESMFLHIMRQGDEIIEGQHLLFNVLYKNSGTGLLLWLLLTAFAVLATIHVAARWLGSGTMALQAAAFYAAFIVLAVCLYALFVGY